MIVMLRFPCEWRLIGSSILAQDGRIGHDAPWIPERAAGKRLLPAKAGSAMTADGPAVSVVKQDASFDVYRERCRWVRRPECR
jgi:hypothetical protein